MLTASLAAPAVRLWGVTRIWPVVTVGMAAPAATEAVVVAEEQERISGREGMGGVPSVNMAPAEEVSLGTAEIQTTRMVEVEGQLPLRL